MMNCAVECKPGGHSIGIGTAIVRCPLIGPKTRDRRLIGAVLGNVDLVFHVGFSLVTTGLGCDLIAERIASTLGLP